MVAARTIPRAALRSLLVCGFVVAVLAGCQRAPAFPVGPVCGPSGGGQRLSTSPTDQVTAYTEALHKG